MFRTGTTILATLAACAGLGAQELELQLQPSQLRLLESAARSLAAAGRTSEMQNVLDLLVTLGQSDAAQQRLREQCEDVRVVPARVQRSQQSAVRQLNNAARRLTNELAELEEPQRRALANALVRIGGEVDEAHEILGHVRTDAGEWTTPHELRLDARRVQIQDAMLRARKLPVPIEVAESRHPTLRHVHGVPGIRLSWRQVEIHTVWPEARARRTLTESLRASAFSNWLVTGELELPPVRKTIIVLLGSERDYQKAIDFDLSRGAITPDQVDFARRISVNFSSPEEAVGYSHTEGAAQTILLSYWLGSPDTELHGKPAQACLVAGHFSWVCLAYLGQPSPAHPRLVRESDELQSQPTVAQRRAEATREQMKLLIGAGLVGTRSWLQYLVRTGTDQPWVQSMVRLVNDMDEDHVLKSTLVAEYLQELGILGKVVGGTRDAVGQPIDTVVQHFEEALGQPLPEFEQDWLLGNDRPLLHRLSTPMEGAESPAEAEALRHLNGLRERAFATSRIDPPPPVTIDPQLSEGARLHARYLVQNPDQALSWPEAHEEFVDRDGFTPAGAWAGAHSVIDPGASSPTQAIDRWMGTFYHRLPLLEPGLLRIGYAQQDRTAVLDSGSIVRRRMADFRVVWPPHGTRNVPRSFVPELPNPIPGEDQSEWGYPITLQLLPSLAFGSGPRIQMSLHIGGAEEPAVDCHFSSPFNPTNPDLVPDNAYCLIPKSPLRSNTMYVVVAQFPNGERMEWSFRT